MAQSFPSKVSNKIDVKWIRKSHELTKGRQSSKPGAGGYQQVLPTGVTSQVPAHRWAEVNDIIIKNPQRIARHHYASLVL